MLRSNKLAARVGAIAGFVFTRLPYMEDGNLLVTSVVVLSAASITLLLWLGIKRAIER